MILFNAKSGLKYLSNFYGSFFLDGLQYFSPELYYQSRKSAKIDDRLKILNNSKNSVDAKKLGKTIELRNNWDDIKVKILTRAIRAKFFQNKKLQDTLISTKGEVLAEDAPWDRGNSFWGYPGKNITGKILMDIRGELLENSHTNKCIVIGTNNNSIFKWKELVLDRIREDYPFLEILLLKNTDYEFEKCIRLYALNRRIPIYFYDEKNIDDKTFSIIFKEDSDENVNKYYDILDNEKLVVINRPKIWTGQFRYSGKDRLDITAKANNAFSPSFQLVNEYKNGRIDGHMYTQIYNKRMKNTYIAFREEWVDVLMQDETTLVCYCPKNKFCHRHLLSFYFEKLGAKYMGERTK